MDAITLMMSSMTQSPATAAAVAVVTQAGQAAGDASGKTLDFSALLGSSLQAQMPVVISPKTVAVETPMVDLKGLMTFMPETTESGQTDAKIPTKISNGDEAKELSVMQLLQGLKSGLAANADTNSKIASEVLPTEMNVLMAANISNLSLQGGGSTAKAKETASGNSNPEVLAENAAKDMADSTGAVNNQGGQLAELVVALNGLLPHLPKQTIEANVTVVDLERLAVNVPAMPMQQNVVQALLPGQDEAVAQLQQNAVQAKAGQNEAVALMQQNVVQAKSPEKAVLPDAEKSDSDGLPLLDADRISLKTESGKTAQFAGTTPMKVVDDTQKELQTKPVKAQGAAAQNHSGASAVTRTDDLQIAQNRKNAPEISVELVMKEGELSQEQSKQSVVKTEIPLVEKLEPFRTDAASGISVEGKSQQVSADRPVVEEAKSSISREQIMNQVREKLAEHRITQDNGQVTIRLNPAELGELKISVRMDDQRLRVEIVAENKNVKDALMENLGSLKETLARQNVEMKQFDVATGSRQFFNQGFREGMQQDQQQYVAPRQSGWMTGRSADAPQTEPVAWQPRDNALLDMMM
jgi:flagellar hook-length control protein FliK